MSKIQKINIYVGTVGSAYIDKETALKNVEAARKNISDVENIISKAEDIKGNLINSISAADDAKSRATLVKERLASAINDFKNRNAVIYTQLLELKEQVEANDVDGIYKNGGNVKTADNNISNAENQLDEIIKIIESAEVLLEDNKKLLRIREQEYEEAVGEFTQYVPDIEFNIDDLSNNEEAYLNNRINEINDNINIINDVTDHINDYSEETNNIIDSIIDGTNTDNPTDDEGNKLYWYAGQVMPTAQYYESNNDNFIVTEDSVNTWHELTLIKDTRNEEQILKLLAGINSLSAATKWYVLVPESLGLNPVMSDMTTADSRFVPGNNLTTVNGVSYMLYTVNNGIPASEGVNGSRLNIIMITGDVETPEEPVTTDGNYWYIGKTAPAIPYKPEDNLVTDNVSLGWRKIEGDLNNYVESNPYWNGQGISLLGDDDEIEEIDFYIAVPEHTKFKDALSVVDLGSTYDVININGKTYSVYKLFGMEYNLIMYIDPSYNPTPGPTPDPTYTITFKNDEEIVSTISGVTGTAVEVPTGLSKEGFTFKGWSTNGTTVIIPVSNIGTEDITYIAVWEENQQEPVQSSDMYWYLGLTQPTDNTVITDELAENANSLGWHFIGSTLGTYSATNPLNQNTESFILNEDFDDVTYYVVLPGSLKVYDGLGGVVGYDNLGTCTIDGVQYTIYQGLGSEFGFKIF